MIPAQIVIQSREGYETVLVSKCNAEGRVISSCTVANNNERIMEEVAHLLRSLDTERTTEARVERGEEPE